MGRQPSDQGCGERLVFGEVTVVIRVSAEDSGGAMTVLEEVPPMVDTPLHVHTREDELFYIVEGEHIVERGDDEFRLGPGEALFCPRGVPHSQRRASPEDRIGGPIRFSLPPPQDSRDQSGSGLRSLPLLLSRECDSSTHRRAECRFAWKAAPCRETPRTMSQEERQGDAQRS